MDREKATILDLQRFRVRKQQGGAAQEKLHRRGRIRASRLDTTPKGIRAWTPYDLSRALISGSEEEYKIARVVLTILGSIADEAARTRDGGNPLSFD